MSRVNMHVLIVCSYLCEFRTNQKVQDPVTRHFLFEQAQVLHDSLDSLSSDDDCRQTTGLIARFVQLVFYSKYFIQRCVMFDCTVLDLQFVLVVHVLDG